MSRPFSSELLPFAVVGGTGYVIDVTTFNVLRSIEPLATWDPAIARTIAFLVAMCFTYLGHRHWTWRGLGDGRPREITLFVVFNVIGFGFSVGTLIISHDVLGFTSRLADNISANVIGLGLGTVFRYVAYRRWVFNGDEEAERRDEETRSRDGARAGRGGE